jgi:outer membrane protein assembly factor BamB
MVALLVVCIGALTPAVAAAQAAVPAEDTAARIVALDPRWALSFDTAPTAPAGFDQETGYVPLKGGDLVAVELNDGAVRWKVALTTLFTPATGDGLVFAAGDDVVTALDQRTGRTLWRTPLGSPVAAPLYWDSGSLFASTEAGDLVALYPEDGRVLWRTALGSPLAVAPTPSGEQLFVALRDGQLASLDLASGRSTWTYPLKESVTGMLALEEQLLIGTRSNLLHSFALDRARIRWSKKVGADIAGAPVADDDLIYFAAFDNILWALDRGNGGLKWRRNLSSRPAGGPLRADNIVLLPLVTTDIAAYLATTGAESFVIRAVDEPGGVPLGVPFLRENTRPTAPRLIAMSSAGSFRGFSPRIEPPPVPLGDLPGIKVGG